LKAAACVPQKHLTPQRVASNYDSLNLLRNAERISAAMIELKCDACGAELLPGTGFCRKCGAAVSGSGGIDSSEQPTAIFPDQKTANTQRLHPRSTSPTTSERGTTKPPGFRRNVTLLVASIVLLLGVVAALAVLSDRNSSSAPPGEALLYPGATTKVKMSHDEGDRTVQLETSDSLDRVESWYQSNMKVDKTIRLTSNSVVMKNQKVSITLAVENNKTNILIKETP